MKLHYKIANEVVDSRYSPSRERREEQLLMEKRKLRVSKLSRIEVFKAKLMQLKFQMEKSKQ